MPNEENVQQPTNGEGQQLGQILAAIQALGKKLDSVEEIILARLNDTRPFEHQIMARLNQMDEKIDQLRADFNQFREETNENFRLLNEKLEVLGSDVIDVRAKQRLLEKRVARLEEQAA